MDWPNERYVRTYTRDTTDMILMEWDCRCVFWELLRKVDRAGVLDLDGHGTAGLAAHLRVPLEVAERALTAWLEAGWVERTDRGIVVPSHIEAQEATQSDAARARASRERRRDHGRAAKIVTPRDANVTPRDGTVTAGHVESRSVTLALPSFPPSLSSQPEVPSLPGGAGGGFALSPSGPKRARKKPETPIPDAWVPSKLHREFAAKHGLHLELQVEAFRGHAQQNDRRARDWDGAFRTWLAKGVEYASERANGRTRNGSRGRAPPMQGHDMTAEEIEELEAKAASLTAELAHGDP